MRLIDADKLINEICNESGNISATGLYYSYSYTLTVGDIINIINSQPNMNNLTDMLDYYKTLDQDDKDIKMIKIYLACLIAVIRQYERHKEDGCERIPATDRTDRNKD